MKVRPVDDRVIVKPEAVTEISKGGIALVAALDKTEAATVTKGKIIAVGPGERLEDGKVRTLDVSIGDIAIFQTSLGNPITVDGEALVVVKEGDILAVITK